MVWFVRFYVFCKFDWFIQCIYIYSYLFIYPFIYLFVYIPICWFIYLFICVCARLKFQGIFPFTQKTNIWLLIHIKYLAWSSFLIIFSPFRYADMFGSPLFLKLYPCLSFNIATLPSCLSTEDSRSSAIRSAYLGPGLFFDFQVGL